MSGNSPDTPSSPIVGPIYVSVRNALMDRLRMVRIDICDQASATAFAKQLGMRPRTYLNYEKGEREIPHSLLAKLVDVSGCSAAWLLLGVGSPNDPQDDDVLAAIQDAARKSSTTAIVRIQRELIEKLLTRLDFREHQLTKLRGQVEDLTVATRLAKCFLPLKGLVICSRFKWGQTDQPVRSLVRVPHDLYAPGRFALLVCDNSMCDQIPDGNIAIFDPGEDPTGMPVVASISGGADFCTIRTYMDRGTLIDLRPDDERAGEHESFCLVRRDDGFTLDGVDVGLEIKGVLVGTITSYVGWRHLVELGG